MGLVNNNRYQLGKDKKANDESNEIMDKYGYPSPISGFNVLENSETEKGRSFSEPIVQMKAGKQHSLFLSGNGTVYSLGYNLHGQTGLSTYLFPHVETPTEIPTEGLKIKQIETGFHHNLLLDEEGRIYGFGSLTPGKVETLHEIKLPSDSKVTKIHASNMRNWAYLENGEVWFWGGYFYRNKHKLIIDGFNLLNEEEGLPSDHKIVDYQMGFGHDVVMTEKIDTTVIDIENENVKLQQEHSVL